MNSRRKEIALVTAGVLAGIAVSGPATQAAAGLMANPSSQRFYVNEQRIPLEAYEINGSNYVKLRDIGQAVDFGITYDAGTNTVTIHPDEPYEMEVSAPASTTPTSQTAPSALSTNADGSINVPQDGSRYIPQAGDVIRCDDGTNYTITDVSRYDKNYFADGPVGPLPEATCDWSQFDQPELPPAEARHFTVEGDDLLFVRNLHESRRMLYTLYNAMGAHPSTWKDGKAVTRKNGTPWIHIHMTMPEGRSIPGFWPWRAEQVTDMLASCPCGDYYLDCWDVYMNGVFQRTEYKIA